MRRGKRKTVWRHAIDGRTIEPRNIAEPGSRSRRRDRWAAAPGRAGNSPPTPVDRPLNAHHHHHGRRLPVARTAPRTHSHTQSTTVDSVHCTVHALGVRNVRFGRRRVVRVRLCVCVYVCGGATRAVGVLCVRFIKRERSFVCVWVSCVLRV